MVHGMRIGEDPFVRNDKPCIVTSENSGTSIAQQRVAPTNT